MIVALKGRLEDVTESAVVLEVNGLSYEVNVSGAVRSNLPPLGQELRVHTYLQVREDALVLYGFASGEERTLFQEIIGVAGIGPKTGLAILSGISPLDFMRAVEEQQLSVLMQLPGIGKKTGERLLLELKGKFRDVLRGVPKSEGLPGREEVLEDAVQALIALGYSAKEAEEMVRAAWPNVTEDCDLQELLKLALAKNTKQRGEPVWRRNE